MKIVFLSNYFSHHQRPLSDALAKRADYAFIATAQMTEERRAMGWGTEEEPGYVCHYDEDPAEAEDCLAGADVVIAGSAPETLIRQCIGRGQLVLRYQERPLKKGAELKKYLPRLLKWHLQNPPGKKIWLLCASAYTAGDYAWYGLFRGRALRWGYFPEVREYGSMEELLDNKKKASILWAGRFLDWKHPDDAIQVAARLKKDGISFELDLIGGGPMQPQLEEMIRAEDLQDCVRLLGNMEPNQVRRHMEESEIFLFTSGRQEGWGAVLNEAMNSGCAVVAGHAAGASPYLVRDGENGFLYRSGDVDALYYNVRLLLTNDRLRRRFGAAACETMTACWNGENAAERLVAVARQLLNGEQPKLPADGPCSLSPRIGEGWYRK